MHRNDNGPKRPPTHVVPAHVVILGGGFAGLEAAKSLAKAPVTVTVIDRQNYHLFQPLLYQVATAALSPADIAAPIRSILRQQPRLSVLLDEVIDVDATTRTVSLASGKSVSFDYLVIATGARHSYFGHDDWAGLAPGLKTLDDALLVRRRVLLALERAEAEADENHRRALLTFLIVGGGPTGVEMAGAVAELVRRSASRDFRLIMPQYSRVILVEHGPRVLATFPSHLSDFARRALERLGVEVWVGRQVDEIGPDRVRVGDTFVPCCTAIWAAGVMASPAATWLGATRDRSGRVEVGADLRPAGLERVFVIGDTAAMKGADGRPLPGVAPVAKAQGRHVGRSIPAILKGQQPAPFRYHSPGNLATIGRRSAVIDFGRVWLKGWLAWVVWSVAHIWFLIGFRNRFVVAATWMWNYVTYERSARLITGTVSPRAEQARSSAALVDHVDADRPE